MKDFFEFKNKKRFLKVIFTGIVSLSVSFLFFSLISKYSSKLSAANVLTNPSFTGNITGWSPSSGSTLYDSSYYQNSIGSLKNTATKNQNLTLNASQTIGTSIQAGSTVNLSLYWSKQCVVANCTINTIRIEIAQPSAPTTWISVWEDTSIPAIGSATSWASVSQDVSSTFDETGTYYIRAYARIRTPNTNNAITNAWFDNMNLDVTPPNITVGTTNTQISSTYANINNLYIGGAFTFVRDTGSTSVTSITISETGTISDANISGLILYYKQEATCSSTFPTGTTQFNSTPGSFSSGSSTVTGTMTVGTSQICVYVEADIGSASTSDTIEIQITNPSTQVTASAGNVSPATAVAISGTTTIVANQAPSFTVFSDNGPVDPGSNITFSTTASDPDTDTIKLVVCKTQGVTGIACDGGSGDTWCTSSLVSSNPSCQYSVPSVTPDDTYNAYPYIFDSKDLGSSSSLQGALDTYTVNNVAPVVSAVTINGGSAITLTAGTTKSVTLTATVSDNNSCYGGEIASVLGYVYRSGIGYLGSGGTDTYYFNGTGGITDQNNKWSDDSNTFDGSTLTYTSLNGVPSKVIATTSSNYLHGESTTAPSDGTGITQVRARIFGGGTNPLETGGTIYGTIYTNTLGEELGEVSATSTTNTNHDWGSYVILNTPTDGWTWQKVQDLEVKLWGTADIQSKIMAFKIEVEVTSTTGTGCNESADANNNNCYPEITCTVVGGTCTDITDSSANYTCTAALYSYADPTDTGTLYPTEYWMDTIKATDDDSGVGYTEVSPGVKLNSLLGFNITTSLDYGSLNVNAKNDPLDRTTTITPTGNVGLDHELSGPTNMCTDFPTCSGGTIAIGYQKYALSASTAYSSVSATALTTSANEAETNVPKPISGTPTTKSIWWGMLVPTNTSPGSYDGSITVTGVKGETVNW